MINTDEQLFDALSLIGLVTINKELSSLQSPESHIILNKIKDEKIENKIAIDIFGADKIEYEMGSLATSIEYIYHIFSYMYCIPDIKNFEILFYASAEKYLVMNIKFNDGCVTEFIFDTYHRMKVTVNDNDGFISSFNFCASDKSHKKCKIMRILPFCFGVF